MTQPVFIAEQDGDMPIWYLQGFYLERILAMQGRMCLDSIDIYCLVRRQNINWEQQGFLSLRNRVM